MTEKLKIASAAEKQLHDYKALLEKVSYEIERDNMTWAFVKEELELVGRGFSANGLSLTSYMMRPLRSELAWAGNE